MCAQEAGGGGRFHVAVPASVHLQRQVRPAHPSALFSPLQDSPSPSCSPVPPLPSTWAPSHHTLPPLPQVIPTSELLARARAAVDTWAPVSNHPSMVGLRAAFVSSEMDGGNPALFFAHDYHPGSFTLAQVRPDVMPAVLPSPAVPPPR